MNVVSPQIDGAIAGDIKPELSVLTEFLPGGRAADKGRGVEREAGPAGMPAAVPAGSSSKDSMLWQLLILMALAFVTVRYFYRSIEMAPATRPAAVSTASAPAADVTQR